jgi:predicted dehydrogenase
MHDIEKSGGPIFDYSIHFIELARACMDSEAKEVCYMGANTTGLVKSDDQATMLVQYESGGFGEFTKSWSFPTNVRLGHQTTHVVCRNAVVTLDPNVIIHTANGDREVTAKSEIPGRAEGYLNLISAIENDTPLFASELEGLRTIEILDTALKSRESGKKEQVQIHND